MIRAVHLVTMLRACPASFANRLVEAIRVSEPGFLAVQSMVFGGMGGVASLAPYNSDVGTDPKTRA
jgi:hypothetical protein